MRENDKRRKAEEKRVYRKGKAARALLAGEAGVEGETDSDADADADSESSDDAEKNP